MVVLATLERDCLDKMNYLRTQTWDTLVIDEETRRRIDPTHEPAQVPEDLDQLFDLQQTIEHYGIDSEESHQLKNRVRKIESEITDTQETIRNMIEAAVQEFEQVKTELTAPKPAPSRGNAKPPTTPRRNKR